MTEAKLDLGLTPKLELKGHLMLSLPMPLPLPGILNMGPVNFLFSICFNIIGFLYNSYVVYTFKNLLLRKDP